MKAPRAVRQSGQHRRLEFIDFRLYWEGRINRADLTEHFGISVPQASLDLTRYQQIAPENLEYDRRKKVYSATPAFAPALAADHADSYLDQLLAVATGSLPKDSVFVGWAPHAGVVRGPRRRIPPIVLLHVLRAIRDNLAIKFSYQTFRQSTPIDGLMSPHAIAFDGFRWHARAFCHAAQVFRDFALARVLSVECHSKASANGQADDAWNTFVEVKVAPHPDVTDAARKALELEYGMTNGVVVIPTRVALIGYLMRQLGLFLDAPDTAEPGSLQLANADKLRPYLESASYRDAVSE